VRPEQRSAAGVALVAAALFATIIGAAVTAAAVPAAAGARRQSEKSWQRCAVPARLSKGQIVVPVVVDFGGSDGKVLVTCVVTHAGDTGAQVLQAQAPLVGYPVPRYDASGSGLLCGIDGYPSTGCGTESGGHYSYWAYWHGGKSWQYANDGPGEWTVSKGDVEGWRFEPDGSASPADPPPRARSSASELETSSQVGRAKTTSKAAAKSSTAGAAGPVGETSDDRKAKDGLFVVCLALIVLIGAAAITRSRRTSRRVT
jgi:hypothetical protein